MLVSIGGSDCLGLGKLDDIQNFALHIPPLSSPWGCPTATTQNLIFMHFPGHIHFPYAVPPQPWVIFFLFLNLRGIKKEEFALFDSL